MREAAARGSGYVPMPGDVEIDFAKAAREVRLGAGEGAFVLTGRIDRLESPRERRSTDGPAPAVEISEVQGPPSRAACSPRPRHPTPRGAP